jgi:tryptophanase
VDYLAEVILYVKTIKEQIRGVRIASAPETLRHFTARMEMRRSQHVTQEIKETHQ